MQTGLKSDGFCLYNQSASEYFWVMQPGQYENTYAYGEVGVPVNGGGPGSYIRRDGIDIDSFLSGRDNPLSKCTPPAPSLQDLDMPTLHAQKDIDPDFMIPMYTKQLKSANDLSTVDFDRWTYLPSDPQNLRHVIEELAPSRGGLNTTNFIKLAWNPENNSIPPNNVENFTNDIYDNNNNNNNSNKQNPKLCMLNLDPSRVCGKECEGINGYPGTYPGPNPPYKNMDVTPMLRTKPPHHENYPFTDITSQQLVNVGAAPCGTNYFYGDKYQYGSCPKLNIPHNFS